MKGSRSFPGKTDTDPILIPHFTELFLKKIHILLRKNLTIESHDGGKESHFCYHNGISNHLPLTRGVQPPGQLSLYLLNDLSSLCSEFTKGIIALAVGHL